MISRTSLRFGAEHSTIGATVAKAAKAVGVTLSPDPMPGAKIFVRSDHYSFVQQRRALGHAVDRHGQWRKAAWKAYDDEHYHDPSDDISQPFNWVAGAKFARDQLSDRARAGRRPDCAALVCGRLFRQQVCARARRKPQKVRLVLPQLTHHICPRIEG